MSERRKVPGTWHPKVDVNACQFDNEPLPGLSVGGSVADTRRYVSEDMAGLIRRQEMCYRCLQEFPAPMSSGTRFSAWTEAMDRGQFRVGGPLTRAMVLDRVLNRHCPMCAVPINDGMLKTQVDFKDVR